MGTRRSRALPVAVAMFGCGLLAIAAVFALYVAGHRDLPLWLNVLTLLAPLGLIIGVVSAVRARH